jgi:8-oxo-dGTP pyrophosphatase MutT (NUDIX family)
VTIRAAGILVLSKQGKALFLQRGAGSDFPGAWCFPGGRRDSEETAEQTAIREAEEETGRAFKPGQLKLWTRSLRPQAPSPEVTPPQGEMVDFTTFLVRDEEEFEPDIEKSGEHTGYAWADINNPPQPLHPGCAVALRRFTMDDELQVAEAIRDGELVSPQEYGNIHLFALRISGVGTAFRGAKRDADGKIVQPPEVVFRKPDYYTSPEFLTRAQGLPVIVMHPDEAILDSKQFAERVIGALMITYLRPDDDGRLEPWGIARVYDAAGAAALKEMNLSTSPGVLLGKDVQLLTLEGGTRVIVEGKPDLLDHLAVCPHGVWDKGGEPNGVDNIHTRFDGDDDMKVNLKRIDGETDAGYKARCDEAEALLLARKDSAGDEKLNQLLEGIQGVTKIVGDLKARVDSMEEKEKKDAAEEADKKKADAKRRADAFKFSKKDAAESDDDHKAKHDAEEKALCDAMMEAGDEEDVAKDSAKRRRKDAEDIDKAEEEAAKKKADEDKMKDDSRKDAQTIAELRDGMAKLEAQIKGAIAGPADADRSKLLQAQHRFDSVHQGFGNNARAPLLGESLHEYRLFNLRALQKHSPVWKDMDIGLMAVNDAYLDMAEEQILAAAKEAAANPKDIPAGQIMMRSRQDGGHTYNEWYGEPAAWMRNLAGPVGKRAVGNFKDARPGARRGA